MAEAPRDSMLDSSSPQPSPTPTIPSLLRHAIVCLIGLISMALLLRLKPPHIDDFLPFYRAGRLVGTADLFTQTSYSAKSLMFLRTPFSTACCWGP